MWFAGWKPVSHSSLRVIDWGREGTNGGVQLSSLGHTRLYPSRVTHFHFANDLSVFSDFQVGLLTEESSVVSRGQVHDSKWKSVFNALFIVHSFSHSPPSPLSMPSFTWSPSRWSKISVPVRNPVERKGCVPPSAGCSYSLDTVKHWCSLVQGQLFYQFLHYFPWQTKK